MDRTNQRPMDYLLRMPDVVKATGMSPSAIYKRIKAGSFPEQRKTSPGASGSSAWLSSEVQAWIDSRPTATRECEAAASPATKKRKLGVVDENSSPAAVLASPIQALYRVDGITTGARKWASERGLPVRLVDADQVLPTSIGLGMPDDLIPSADDVSRLRSLMYAVSSRQPARRPNGAFNRAASSVRIGGIRLFVRWSLGADTDDLAALFADPRAALVKGDLGDWVRRPATHPAGLYMDEFQELPALAMSILPPGATAMPRLFMWSVVSPATAAGEVR